MAEIRDALEKALFSDPALRAYVILDGAQNLDLLVDLDSLGVRSECLLIGDATPEELVTAAHLAPLPAGGPFLDWVVSQCVGRNRCVFAVARAEPLHAAAHFKRFAEVTLPDGRIGRFRYYDPRVLRVFLPTCDAAQRAEMFGDVVARYVVENAPGAEPPILTFDA